MPVSATHPVRRVVARMARRAATGVVATGAAVGWTMLGPTAPAMAAGVITTNPNPVLALPSAPSSTTVRLTVTAGDPLPDGITGVTLTMAPSTGGIGFVSATTGCTIGPATTLLCPWAPAASGESLSIEAQVSIAPGLPPQQVPLAWSVQSNTSQDPVDSGSASFDIVTELPSPSPTTPSSSPPATPSPSVSSTPSTGATAPLPTAVPAGRDSPDQGGNAVGVRAPAVLLLLGAGSLVVLMWTNQRRHGSRR